MKAVALMAIVLVCLSCASRVTKTEDWLVPVAADTPGKNIQEIRGTVWQWVQTFYNNGSKAVPVDPKNYTVEFLDNGKLNARADCNLKGGTYSIKGGLLYIDITHSTMAACPDGSLEDQFVRSLTESVSYFLKDGVLYIDLKFDSGTMKFKRDWGEGLKDE